MRYIFLFFLTILLFHGCEQNTNQLIVPSDSKIVYEGRIDSSTQDAVSIFWPGSSIKIKFKGTSVIAILKDNVGETYYNVIVDGDSAGIIKPDTTRKEIKLADLPNGVHTVELYRRTEFTTGTTSFYGFKIDRDATVLPLSEKNHKIVFYGNSITTGYANEDYSGQDRPDSIFTNNYMSYGAITARYFDAVYHCIARGGIGFMVSWYPQIMPELYNRLSPNDASSSWTFSNQTTPLVVVNLGQNDSWILSNPKLAEYQYRFGDSVISVQHIVRSYRNFMQQLRINYPKSPIVCTLGSMDAVAPDSPWPAYIRKAVEALNDENTHTLFFDYLAANRHPGVEEHKQMAATLIHYIERHGLLE